MLKTWVSPLGSFCVARSASQWSAEELLLLSFAGGVGTRAGVGGRGGGRRVGAGVVAGAGLDMLLFVPLVPDVVSALVGSSMGSVLITTPAADSSFGRVVDEVDVVPFPELWAAPDCNNQKTGPIKKIQRELFTFKIVKPGSV